MAEIQVQARDEEAFYTVKSLAQKLSVSLGTAKSMVKEGEIPSYKFRGVRRIDPRDVASFLAEHRDDGRRAA
jgi:excisionase family DNA binding protein